MAIFQTDEERRSYLNYLGEEAERFEVEILAWCLMTNHVHFIAVPKTEDSLARAFGEAHRRYTRMKNFGEGVRGISSRDGSVPVFWMKRICWRRLRMWS